jgi:hypothetical protein
VGREGYISRRTMRRRVVAVVCAGWRRIKAAKFLSQERSPMQVENLKAKNYFDGRLEEWTAKHCPNSFFPTCDRVGQP